ncbi:hypothetical protein [Streptomyces flavidovirens]|uniref:hypothetical protein n=1 Tax=Streptomyces flavidovirens TaxID=67298 RepID=UPI0004293ACC|nr:hypothetical protein [Streptomyces flavidovirens]
MTKDRKLVLDETKTQFKIGDDVLEIRAARQGYSLRVDAVPTVHAGLFARLRPLDSAQGLPAVPARRKARCGYETPISTLVPSGP